MRSLSDLNGVKVLSKKEQKLIVGALTCTRTKDGVSKTFEPVSAASAVAWVDAWDALGWNASCKG